jgi:hypothetical protein
MKRFKIIADFDKEEQYLNEMAHKGFFLQKYSSLGIYTFYKGAPQNLSHRIDYRRFSSKKGFDDYLSLFEDAGWTHIYGTRQSGVQYFIPTAGREQTDDIFSDEESKDGRHKRFAAYCFASMALSAIFFTTGQGKAWTLWDIRSWYFTRGIWEMSGSLFWKAFLFETPFVLFRLSIAMFFLVSAILYGYQALVARDSLKKERNHFRE